MPDQPPAEPPKPVQPVLAYRAVRFVWRVGTAPAIIDFLLILLTAGLVFITMALALVGMINHRLLPVALAIVPASLVVALWYWSNHFHQRQPLGIEEMTDAERQRNNPGNR